LKSAFSTSLDWDAIKNEYQKDLRVRVDNIWTAEHANMIGQSLAKKTQFGHAYTQDGRAIESSEQTLASMSLAERKQLFGNLYKDASNGVGFWYGRHMVNPSSPKILVDAKDYLNSEAALEKIRYISGRSDIKLASAQGTRYTAGNFLTRHNDILEREGRILAFVLSFTPKWHPDWGGLLQFYQNDGTPRDAWTPKFNSMTLFDVRHVHAVTYLPPFSPIQRLSITGWFRSC
jgi:SM-20-related protein